MSEPSCALDSGAVVCQNPPVCYAECAVVCQNLLVCVITEWCCCMSEPSCVCIIQSGAVACQNPHVCALYGIVLLTGLHADLPVTRTDTLQFCFFNFTSSKYP